MVRVIKKDLLPSGVVPPMVGLPAAKKIGLIMVWLRVACKSVSYIFLQHLQFKPMPTSPNHPLHLLHNELKQKSLKKSSLEQIPTIALALGRSRTRQLLLPYLTSLIPSQPPQFQKLILWALGSLLGPVYIGRGHHARPILQIIIDVLCVYGVREVRTEAFGVLGRVLRYMDVAKAQGVLLEALEKLDQEKDESNIRELVVRMVPYVWAGADEGNKERLLKIAKGFLGKLGDQRLLAENLDSYAKLTPSLPSEQMKCIIDCLLETKDKQILCSLVDPIISLTLVPEQSSLQTLPYLQSLLQSPQLAVVSTLLRRYPRLASTFPPQQLLPLQQRLSDYECQPQQIKNTILQLLDSLPMSPEQVARLYQPASSSLQLKNTLSESLCRMGDMAALTQLLACGAANDVNFQCKIFARLPPVAQPHVDIVQRILSNRSWRQKITILKDIEARATRGQSTEILLHKLSEHLGDKIAAVRVAVMDCLRVIVIERDVQMGELLGVLAQGRAAPNWFWRQAVYRLLLAVCKQVKQQEKDKKAVMQFIEPGLREDVGNIRSVVQQLQELLIS